MPSEKKKSLKEQKDEILYKIKSKQKRFIEEIAELKKELLDIEFKIERGGK